MEIDERTRLRFQFLMKEHEITGTAIRNLYLTLDRVIGVSAAFVTVAAAYLWANKLYAPIVFVPFAFIGVMYYMMFLYAELMELAGYKANIEREINDIVDQDVALWESVLVPGLGKTFPGKMVAIVIQFSAVYAIALLAAATYFAAVAVWSSYTRLELALIGLILLVCYAVLISITIAVFRLRAESAAIVSLAMSRRARGQDGAARAGL